MSAGIALTLAPLGVLFRDTVQVLQVSLPILFWVTPIVYTSDILPTWAQNCQALNPMLPMLKGIHELLISGTIPDTSTWAMMASIPILTLILGQYTITHLNRDVRDAI